MIKYACLITTTVLYIGQAGVLAYYKEWANMVIFSGYAFANIGLIWSLNG